MLGGYHIPFSNEDAGIQFSYNGPGSSFAGQGYSKVSK
jgi:hypothetical protein